MTLIKLNKYTIATFLFNFLTLKHFKEITRSFNSVQMIQLIENAATTNLRYICMYKFNNNHIKWIQYS